MQRAPSEPYRSTSPFGPQSLDRNYPSQQATPAGTAQVPLGALIVVTNSGPDGRVTYQQHKSVFASYQIASGIVSGIQWIPTELPSYIPPTGSHNIIVSGHDPNSWAKSYLNAVANWQRSEDKTRKQEEKEANRYREQTARNNYDYDPVSRERDRHGSGFRDRSRSFGAGSTVPPASVPFPGQSVSSTYSSNSTGVTNGYLPNPYSNYGTTNGGQPQPPANPSVYPTGFSTHGRNRSGSFPDLTRQMKDLELDRNKEYPEARSRKSSSASRREYNTSESTYERARTISGNYADRPNPNPYPLANGAYPSVQPYGIPTQTQAKFPDPYNSARYVAPSPNMRPLDIASSFGVASSGGYAGSDYSIAPSRTSGEPVLRSTTPFGNPPPQVYPPGHILEGQSIIASMVPQSRSRAPSRAPSPSGSTVIKPSLYPSKSPHIASIPLEPQQLAAPEAFSRPINAANTFAPFDMIKIEDIEDICDPPYPKMPPVLTTHDIYHDDWKRCMQDLGRSWTGQLPVPGLKQNGLPPRRSTLAADLVSLWNHSFFYPRGIELILYKGRERRTGPQAGDPTVRLPKYDTDDSSSSSSSSSSDSEDSGYRKRMTDPYGRPLVGQAEMEARRQREDKQEKKRRRKEKKARRKAKAREKAYTVYVACLPQGPTAMGPFNNRPGPVQGALRVNSMTPAGYAAPTYGPPNTTTAYGGPNGISAYGAPNPVPVYAASAATSAYSAPTTNSAYGTPNTTVYGSSNTIPGYGSSNTIPGYGTPAVTPAYGVPVGIPTTRSYGYGGGY